MNLALIIELLLIAGYSALMYTLGVLSVKYDNHYLDISLKKRDNMV